MGSKSFSLGFLLRNITAKDETQIQLKHRQKNLTGEVQVHFTMLAKCRRDICPRSSLIWPATEPGTFLVLLLGDHCHGHGVGWGQLPRTRDAADLQRAEIAFQGVLDASLPLLSLFSFLWPLNCPVIDLEAHHLHTRTQIAGGREKGSYNLTLRAKLRVISRNHAVHRKGRSLEGVLLRICPTHFNQRDTKGAILNCAGTSRSAVMCCSQHSLGAAWSLQGAKGTFAPLT